MRHFLCMAIALVALSNPALSFHKKKSDSNAGTAGVLMFVPTGAVSANNLSLATTPAAGVMLVSPSDVRVANTSQLNTLGLQPMSMPTSATTRLLARRSGLASVANGAYLPVAPLVVSTQGLTLEGTPLRWNSQPAAESLHRRIQKLQLSGLTFQVQTNDAATESEERVDEQAKAEATAAKQAEANRLAAEKQAAIDTANRELARAEDILKCLENHYGLGKPDLDTPYTCTLSKSRSDVTRSTCPTTVIQQVPVYIERYESPKPTASDCCPLHLPEEEQVPEEEDPAH